MIAGASARPSAAVATSVGPCPTTQSASGCTGPPAGRLGVGDPDAANEGRPPGVGALLRAAGGAVEEQRVGDAGEAAETTVEAEDAHLDGGGPEIDGDEDAGVGGHEAEW